MEKNENIELITGNPKKAINKLERKVTYLYAGTKQDSKEDTF